MLCTEGKELPAKGQQMPNLRCCSLALVANMNDIDVHFPEQVLIFFQTIVFRKAWW